MTMAPLVWLVTGCSCGFGKELANAILARGDKVIATSRNVDNVKFPGATVFDLDVTAPQEEIDAKILGALEIHGRIDVLVNNAGFIEFGTLEETRYGLGGYLLRNGVEEKQRHSFINSYNSEAKWLSQFNTNVFGAAKVTRAILPHFRQRREGVAVFISSVSGWSGDPFAGVYCGSKFALEGKCLPVADMVPRRYITDFTYQESSNPSRERSHPWESNAFWLNWVISEQIS